MKEACLFNIKHRSGGAGIQFSTHLGACGNILWGQRLADAVPVLSLTPTEILNFITFKIDVPASLSACFSFCPCRLAYWHHHLPIHPTRTLRVILDLIAISISS